MWWRTRSGTILFAGGFVLGEGGLFLVPRPLNPTGVQKWTRDSVGEELWERGAPGGEELWGRVALGTRIAGDEALWGRGAVWAKGSVDEGVPRPSPLPPPPPYLHSPSMLIPGHSSLPTFSPSPPSGRDSFFRKQIILCLLVRRAYSVRGRASSHSR